MKLLKQDRINQMTLRFPSRSANEGFARSAAAAFIAQLDPTVEQVYDIKTAVSEAVTNAIVHGYRDRLGTVTLTVRLYRPAAVEIIIADKGCGIENVKQAREPLFTTGGADRSGMGFTIMESFMDGVTVRSKPGKGTTVTLKKALQARQEA
ncbi:MAG: anti-sigma F factor [Clostridia bacterium]|nr:anti-sigma F factor [Clostridia bacterium]